MDFRYIEFFFLEVGNTYWEDNDQDDEEDEFDEGMFEVDEDELVMTGEA